MTAVGETKKSVEPRVYSHWPLAKDSHHLTLYEEGLRNS